MCRVVDQVHLLEASQDAPELGGFVKQNMQTVIRDHGAVHGDHERDSIHSAANEAISPNEQKANGRYYPKRKADEQFPRVFSNLEITCAVRIVHTMMFPLSAGIKGLLAVAHFIMPPAMAKIVRERPDTPTGKKIRAERY